jgi:hypothetical protein
VSWDEQWRYGTVEGTPEAPGVTRIDFVEHVKAPSGAAEMKDAMRDRVAAIASVVRGGPVPACK